MVVGDMFDRGFTFVELGDPPLVDVEANHLESGTHSGQRKRNTDVAQADDADLEGAILHTPHERSCNLVFTRSGHTCPLWMHSNAKKIFGVVTQLLRPAVNLCRCRPPVILWRGATGPGRSGDAALPFGRRTTKPGPDCPGIVQTLPTGVLA